ncbi:MAG TPA: DedA family protein [Verrucomicrobiae bacterium]|nr:DedA family protein [Verrucomicrobiae bacterium]
MFDVTHLIQTGGLLLIAAIIFGESGMMIGFFFPGDTLLFSAGILAATGKLGLASVLVTIALAAIAGDNVGYHIGRKLGRRLFHKPDGVLFRKEHIDRAEAFYKKHGSKTMLVAHFIPVVRAFVPVTAGAARMPYPQYVIFDAIGDTAWTFAMVLLGYFIGSKIPGIEKLIDPLLIGIVIIFLAPTLWHIARDPKIRSALADRLRRQHKT